MAQASTEDWLASVRRRKNKEYVVRAHRPRGEHPSVIRPKNLNELHAVLDPGSKRAKPIRPLGAGSAATACATAAGGTVIDMTALDDIVDIGDDTVTVQAGVVIGKLAEALEQHGKEMPGCIDLVNRTVGGAVASACIGPSLARDGGHFASQVVSLKAVTPQGKLLTVDRRRGRLLDAFRLSYGLLGVIYEVTLAIRPLSSFVRKQKKMDVKSFTHAAERLAGTDVGIKFYLMPFKNQVFTELRRYEQDGGEDAKQPWKLKDWGETAVLPKICGKLSSVVPIPSLRYSLVDSVQGMGQSLLTSARVGGDAVEQGLSTTGAFAMPPLCYSTWCFPASELTMALHGYGEFCRRYYKQHRFRCDMPAVGFKLAQDQSALLSPSFEGPMYALRTVSSPNPAWDDFVLELAEFASDWGAVPLFNQSRALEMRYASVAYGQRLALFRKIRNEMDPENRMLNPFLAQYFC